MVQVEPSMFLGPTRMKNGPEEANFQANSAPQVQEAISPEDEPLGLPLSPLLEASDANYDLPKNAIAITGMAFRMPGASDADALWSLLESGHSTISQIPPSRFEASKYTHKQSSSSRKMEVLTGNFVDDVESFDNELFGISPREARSMDPQQRLLLHVAHEALQDAGYVPNTTPTSDPATFGVFVGAATHDYVHNLRENIDMHYSSGTLSSFLSGRISYAMSFSGPSVVVDTACSSSGVALHQAVRSLQNQDCIAALAGGVNVITSPDLFLGLDAGRFLTHSGQSRPFDANADGYSRAEGCVLFVLKRLSDAIQENDRILGTIRGIEISQSGQASSITRTHSPTQTLLLQKLLEKAHISMSQVQVVECHAAGTKIGDTTEIQAIRNVSGMVDTGVDDQTYEPLFLTSIKANLGHMEAASGASSLAKVILMLRHQRIPPQIGVGTLNAALLASNNPCEPRTRSRRIVVPLEEVVWNIREDGEPRYAIVNNYGASGSNVAILIQEPPRLARIQQEAAQLWPEPFSRPCVYAFPLGLSAPNEETLAEWRCRVVSWLEKEDEELAEGLLSSSSPRPRQRQQEQNVRSLGLDVAYTLTARRHTYDYRISFTCHDDTDRYGLAQNLKQARIQNVHDIKMKMKMKMGPHVVFVLSGQGSQFEGMGAAFYRFCPSYREDIDACVAIATRQRVRSFLPFLLDENIKGEQPSEKQEEGDYRDDAGSEQLALFAFEYALSRLWMSWGLHPSALIGHSLGEYVALVISGVLSLEDAIKLITTRTRLIREHCQCDHPGESSSVGDGSSGMLGIHMHYEALRTILDTHTDLLGSDNGSSLDDVTIACFNSRAHCTAAGPIQQLRQLDSLLKDGYGIKDSRFLRVHVGYHSQAVSPIIEDFNEVLKSVTFDKPKIPIASSVTGKLILPGASDASQIDPAYLAAQCVQPVLFHQATKSLSESQHFDFTNRAAIFIEIGPQPHLLSFLRADLHILQDALYLSSMRKGEDLLFGTLSLSLSRLYSSTGLMVEWKRVFGDLFGAAASTGPKLIGVPFMPFRDRRFWVRYRETGPADPPDAPNQAVSNIGAPWTIFDQFWTQHPSEDNRYEARFKVPLVHWAELIRGHEVRSLPLCPASVYLDIAISGVYAVEAYLEEHRTPSCICLDGVEFVTPLTLIGNDDAISVVLAISVLDDGHQFTIASPSALSRGNVVYAQGRFKTERRVSLHKEYASVLPFVTARLDTITSKRVRSYADASYNNNRNCVDRASLTSTSTSAHPDEEGEHEHEVLLASTTIYDTILPRVVRYSKEFRALERVVVSDDRGEAWGVMTLPPETFDRRNVIHPVYVDTLVHFAGLLANFDFQHRDRGRKENSQGGEDLEECMFVCVGIERITVLPDAFENGHKSKGVHYDLYCSIASATCRGRGTLKVAEVTGIKPPITGDVFSGRESAGGVIARIKNVRFQKVPCYMFLRSVRSGTDYKRESSRSFSSGSGPSSPSSFSLSTPLEWDPNSSSDLLRPLSTVQSSCSPPRRLIPDHSRSYPTLAKDNEALPFVAKEGSVIAYSRNEVIPTTVGAARVPDLRQIISAALQIPVAELSDHSSLPSIGLDSLGSIEIIHVLTKTYGLGTSCDLFQRYMSLGEAQEWIDELWRVQSTRQRDELGLESTSVSPANESPRGRSLHPSASFTCTSNLRRATGGLQLLHRATHSSMPLSNGRKRTPLCLIHDGSGLTASYSRLFESGREDFDHMDVWGIHDPHFGSSNQWTSLDEMIEHYTRLVLDSGFSCIILGGWSFGGIVAFEIARRICQLGDSRPTNSNTLTLNVKGVVLIDSPSPTDGVYLNEETIDWVLSRGLYPDLSNSASFTKSTPPCSESQSKDHLKTEFMSNVALLRQHFHEYKALSDSHPEVFELPAIPVILLACTDRVPLPPGCPVRAPSFPCVRLANGRDNNIHSWFPSWKNYIGTLGSLTMILIPGHHFEIFEASKIDSTRNGIREACERIDYLIPSASRVLNVTE